MTAAAPARRCGGDPPMRVRSAAHSTRNRRSLPALAVSSLPGQPGQCQKRERPRRCRAVERRTLVVRARHPHDDPLRGAPVRAVARRVDEVVIAAPVRPAIGRIFVCHGIAPFVVVARRPDDKKPGRDSAHRASSGAFRFKRRSSLRVPARAVRCSRAMRSSWVRRFLSDHQARRARARHGSCCAGGGIERIDLKPFDGSAGTRRTSSGRERYAAARPPKTAASGALHRRTSIALRMPARRTRRSGARSTAM